MKVILKEGKERALLQRHPWIFSGAIHKIPEAPPGEILSVYSARGSFLAKAYFNVGNSLAGRVLTFKDEPVVAAIVRKLQEAYELRKTLPFFQTTNAFRLINAEGDGLPGLIVDCYSDGVVVQIHTAGMERLKQFIVERLIELLKPNFIYEKSTSSARKLEGLKEQEGLLYGELMPEVEIFEEGLHFTVPIIEGQKTGFFLDQREMRKLVRSHAQGRRVLNCFSYTGAFSAFALKGGAQEVINVDSAQKALSYAPTGARNIQQDVFVYLKEETIASDFIILDPPAFVKKRQDLEAACRGYKEINRLAFEKAPPKSFLLTSSCSYYMDEGLFQTLLFQAAHEAQRTVRILARHRQAEDHPVSLFHPEGAYLKSFFLYLE